MRETRTAFAAAGHVTAKIASWRADVNAVLFRVAGALK